MSGHSKPSLLFIIILGMLCAFGPICTDIYLPALPSITSELNSDPAAIQLSLTSSFLGLALGQIVIGPISDACGRKWPLLGSLLLFILASALCALAPDVVSLVLLRLMQGFAGAGGIVLARTMACDLFKGPALTSFMALLMAVNSLAPILGPILGSLIITYLDWRYLFWFLAVWGLGLLWLSGFKLNDTLPSDQRKSNIVKAVAGMFRECGNLKFMCLSLALSVVMGGFFAYLSASPFVFQQIYGFSPLAYALIFGINAVGITLLAQLSGRLAKRIGEVKIVAYSLALMLIAGACMVIIALIKPQMWWPAFIALLVFVSLVGSSQSAGFGIAMGAVRGGAGAASGLFGVLQFIFGALCSPLVGLMGEQSMLPLGLCMAISALISCLLFVIGIRLKKV